jgi:hypothetical protein
VPEMRHDRAPGAVHYLHGVGVGVHLVLHHSLEQVDVKKDPIKDVISFKRDLISVKRDLEPVDVRGGGLLLCRVCECWLLGACWSCTKI